MDWKDFFASFCMPQLFFIFFSKLFWRDLFILLQNINWNITIPQQGYNQNVDRCLWDKCKTLVSIYRHKSRVRHIHPVISIFPATYLSGHVCLAITLFFYLILFLQQNRLQISFTSSFFSLQLRMHNYLYL